MVLNLKITAGLLLLVQAFHLASFQESTDSPGRTIDKKWLRELAKITAESQNSAVTEEETDHDTMESSNDYTNGIPSGSMVVYNEEEDNVAYQDKVADETSGDRTAVTATVPPTFHTNVTTKQPELPGTADSPTNATSDPTNSSQINITEVKEELHNSTATPQTSTSTLSAQNSTSSSNNNHTDLHNMTTLAPVGNATQESTAKPDNYTGLSNATEFTNTSTPTTTMKQEIDKTSTTSPSTSETRETSLATTNAAAPITTEKTNKTDKDGASGSSSERGLATVSHKSKSNRAWGAVLGTAVAVTCLGLAAYVILKKKHQKGFSHRKLVEDYPSDSVHRLDNSAPLDLNFGGLAYYNPGLQGDNVQMTNFPGRR